MAKAQSLTWEAVRAWRVGRQFLDRLDGGSAQEIAERLCGIQAQVPSAAALAVASRQATPDPQATATAIQDRTLIRTWAARGTLHLLPLDLAAPILSLLADARTWHKASWQRTFITLGQLEAIAAAVTDALGDGQSRTRAELTELVLDRTGDQSLGDHLSSGWSAVLKPLAWQGLLAQGPAQPGRITFVRPDRWFADWPGLPDPDAAAPSVIRAYLGVFGPASPAAFDQWLIRGVTPKARLRAWFAELVAAGEIVTVDVEGTSLYARSEDVDELARSRPTGVVRLVPGFDQFVLGPGTSDEQILDAGQRPVVSRAGGWISPLVIAGDRIAGTWTAPDGVPVPELFPGVTVPRTSLDAEVRRLSTLLTAVPADEPGGNS